MVDKKEDEVALEASGVEIQLGGETRELQVTVKAATQINRLMGGGIAQVANRLPLLDLDIYVAIVRIGLGLAMNSKEGQAVEELVFKEGMNELLVPLSEYISLITTGGKRRPAYKDGDVDKPGKS